MAISIRHVTPSLWAIVSTRFIPAVRDECKATPGLRWNPHQSWWEGPVDAVDVAAGRLIARGFQVDGNLERIEVKLIGEKLGGLRDYQKTGVDFVVSHAADGALLADDMGLGKSAQAIRAAAILGGPVVVVCPAFVRHVWRKEIKKWAAGLGLVPVDLEGEKKRLINGKPLEEETIPGDSRRRVYIINYDVVHAWLVFFTLVRPHVTIYDECFPAGTSVETPNGPRAIETISAGDRVLNAVGAGDVRRVGSRRAPLRDLRLVVLEDGREVICTTAHPWLTPNGWIAAGALMSGSFTLDVVHTQTLWSQYAISRVPTSLAHAPTNGTDMQRMQAATAAPADGHLLFEILRREVERTTTKRSGQTSSAEANPGISRTVRVMDARGSCSQPAVGTSLQPPHDQKQPDAVKSRQSQSQSCDATTRWMEATRTRWERSEAPVTGEDASGCARSIVETHDRADWATGTSTDALQDRLGARAAQDCCGSRRPQPLRPQGARPPQGSVPPLVRVVRVTVPESSDFARLGLGGADDQGCVEVFNLEVSGHPSYAVAGGLVVHNCHYLQSENSRRSKACRELSALTPRRIGLSGTPMTSRPKDLWNVVETLRPGTFGRPFDFYMRHCDARKETIRVRTKDGPEDRTVWKMDGATNLDELKYRLGYFMLRRVKSDVALELPARTRQIVDVDVERKHRGAGLSAAFSGDRALREALSLAADGKIKTAVELILSHLEAGSRVVVFSHHKAVAENIAAALRLEDKRTAVITGEVAQDKRAAIIKAQPEVLCATMDSTGVGIDLTFADVAMFVELDWVPSKLTQCEARLHRPGQTRPVLIQYVIALATADEVIAETVLAKLENFEKGIGKLDDGLADDLGRGKKKSQSEQLYDLYLAIKNFEEPELEVEEVEAKPKPKPKPKPKRKGKP